MDVVYEQVERPWKLPSDIIATLKKRYEYSAGSMGIVVEGGNINLLQQRFWVPQESIKDLAPLLASLMTFSLRTRTIESKEDVKRPPFRIKRFKA
jgi:hypothetical protein